MASHTVPMCTNWTGRPGDQVTFTNGTAFTATVTASGAWPFTADPGFQIPTQGFTTSLKTGLASAVYYYDVDRCSQKSVTVP